MSNATFASATALAIMLQSAAWTVGVAAPSAAAGLSISAQPSAFYVRQGDQLRQVVRVSCRPEGVAGNIPQARTMTESGNFTFVDTNRPFERDTDVVFWEVYCVRGGQIDFRVYRRQGDAFALVGRGDPQTMKPGLNRFRLNQPIAAKRGDLLGFWLPGDDVVIAVDQGREIRFTPGQRNEPSIPVSQWSSLPRACSICAFGKDQLADVETWDRVQQSGAIEVSSDLERRTVPLAALRRVGEDYALDVAQVQAATDVSIRLKADRFAGQTSVRVTPQPKWNLFMMFSVHTDIGYTATQEDCTRILVSNVLRAVDWCRRRRGLPEPERHRWHVEGSWLLDELARRDQRKEKALEEMVGLFREGLMELNAEYANVHTGACSSESLIRYLYYAAELERKWGIPVRAASQTDVVSYTWAVPSVLAGAGVRYLSVGQNACAGNRNPGHPLFYWEGPDGAKVLTANSLGYARLTGERLWDKPWTLGDQLIDLQAQGYPFDAMLFHGLYSDNVPVNDATHESILCSIDEWNRTWAYPRLICSTVEQYGRYMEDKYGDRIPTVRGHWGDDWEDGIASAALEMGINRRNHELLPACETFAAWACSRGLLPAYPAGQLQDAWRNVLLFDEHTWGAAGSVSQPESEMTRKQWAVKSALATDAAARTEGLWKEVSASLTRGIPRPAGDWAAVLNSLSWARTEPARLDLPPALAQTHQLRVVDGETGKEVPSQRDGQQLVFLAAGVPSVGYKLFRIERGTGARPADQPSAGGVIESAFYRAAADPRSGGLASLTDKQLGQELVDQKSGYGLNEFVHELEGFQGAWRRWTAQAAPPRRPQGASVVRTSQGPLFTSLVCRTQVEGTPQIEQEVILYHGLKRVDFVNRLEKHVSYQPETVYYAFPLAARPPRFTLDLPGAIAAVERDLMGCANRNWFAVEHWVDVRGDGWGATWAPVEAPLVSLGGISHRWIKDIPADRGWLFSMIMNNVWSTNFHAGQGGQLTFRYALTSNRGPLDRAAASRFGAEVSNPLCCSYLGGDSEGQLPPGQGSFCTVQPDSVMVQAIKAAEDGRGLILRLREVAGKRTDARLSFPLMGEFSAWSTDLVERDGKPAPTGADLAEVTVPGNGLATVRIVPR